VSVLCHGSPAIAGFSDDYRWYDAMQGAQAIDL
jgi:hypothetical protein